MSILARWLRVNLIFGSAYTGTINTVVNPRELFDSEVDHLLNAHRVFDIDSDSQSSVLSISSERFALLCVRSCRFKIDISKDNT